MNDIEKAIEQLKHDKENFEALLKEYRPSTIKERVESIIKSHILAIQALEEKLNGSWIPVSERLPKQGIPVLVSDKQGNVCVRAITCEIKGRKYWSQNKYDVLAWMPKPEPYKGVENENK